MTINAAWIQQWKTENQAPFSRRLQHGAQCAFIDGQIKLMKGQHVTTWKDYVFFQFVRVIKKYYDMGIKTVVLAFDHYPLVPKAKNMTQFKRRKHIPCVDFNPSEVLPPTIPWNWDVMIMNRSFKSKVIQLVVTTVPDLIQLLPDQRLIIDYHTFPIHYTPDNPPFEDKSFPPLGEADIKFTRYTKFGDLLVEATDGDYVPISLLHVERMIAENRENLVPDVAACTQVPQISIYRMECKGKREREGIPGVSDEGKETDRKRTYEYLHINNLFRHLHSRILVTMGRAWRDSPAAAICSGHEMKLLSLLISKAVSRLNRTP